MYYVRLQVKDRQEFVNCHSRYIFLSNLISNILKIITYYYFNFIYFPIMV